MWWLGEDKLIFCILFLWFINFLDDGKVCNFLMVFVLEVLGSGLVSIWLCCWNIKIDVCICGVIRVFLIGLSFVYFVCLWWNCFKNGVGFFDWLIKIILCLWELFNFIIFLRGLDICIFMYVIFLFLEVCFLCIWFKVFLFNFFCLFWFRLCIVNWKWVLFIFVLLILDIFDLMEVNFLWLLFMMMLWERKWIIWSLIFGCLVIWKLYVRVFLLLGLLKKYMIILWLMLLEGIWVDLLILWLIRIVIEYGVCLRIFWLIVWKFGVELKCLFSLGDLWKGSMIKVVCLLVVVVYMFLCMLLNLEIVVIGFIVI